MLRFLGAGAILLTIASTASAGERYIEVWNPPEARGGAIHSESAHRQSMHRHASPRAVKFRTRQTPAPMPTVAAKSHRIQGELRTVEPDVTDIPRQITPEGNILRVDSRHADFEVAR